MRDVQYIGWTDDQGRSRLDCIQLCNDSLRIAVQRPELATILYCTPVNEAEASSDGFFGLERGLSIRILVRVKRAHGSDPLSNEGGTHVLSGTFASEFSVHPAGVKSKENNARILEPKLKKIS
jgi:hypothetical protein